MDDWQNDRKMSDLTFALLLVIAGTFLGAYGAFLLKRGADNSEFRFHYFRLDPRIILGLGLYFLASVMYIVALRHTELSLLYPVTSLTYLWATFLAAWRLNEPISTGKVIGLILVLAGIGIIHGVGF